MFLAWIYGINGHPLLTAISIISFNIKSNVTTSKNNFEIKKMVVKI